MKINLLSLFICLTLVSCEGENETLTSMRAKSNNATPPAALQPPSPVSVEEAQLDKEELSHEDALAKIKEKNELSNLLENSKQINFVKRDNSSEEKHPFFSIHKLIQSDVEEKIIYQISYGNLKQLQSIFSSTNGENFNSVFNLLVAQELFIANEFLKLEQETIFQILNPSEESKSQPAKHCLYSEIKAKNKLSEFALIFDLQISEEMKNWPKEKLTHRCLSEVSYNADLLSAIEQLVNESDDFYQFLAVFPPEFFEPKE